MIGFVCIHNQLEGVEKKNILCCPPYPLVKNLKTPKMGIAIIGCIFMGVIGAFYLSFCKIDAHTWCELKDDRTMQSNLKLLATFLRP